MGDWIFVGYSGYPRVTGAVCWLLWIIVSYLWLSSGYCGYMLVTMAMCGLLWIYHLYISYCGLLVAIFRLLWTVVDNCSYLWVAVGNCK